MSTSSSPSPTLNVAFELSEADLAFFQARLDGARRDADGVDDARILAGVADMMNKALAANPPEFVRSRIRALGPLIAMLDDADWRLEGEDRDRVLDMLAYFAEPEDLIPDHTPGIGYLDDAIMIEIVSAALAPELEAYGEFVAHRDEVQLATPEPVVADLEAARNVMQARMRRRRARARAGGVWAHSTVIRHYF
ncbi:YkvA family protein [Maricaulis sp. CAU 1757]